MMSNDIVQIMAKKWDSSRPWCDNNRDIVRYVYQYSHKNYRRQNIECLAQCVGIDVDVVWQIANIKRWRAEKKRRQHGQKSRPWKPHKYEGAINLAQVESWGGGKKTKGGGRVSIQAGQFYGA